MRRTVFSAAAAATCIVPATFALALEPVITASAQSQPASGRLSTTDTVTPDRHADEPSRPALNQDLQKRVDTLKAQDISTTRYGDKDRPEAVVKGIQSFYGQRRYYPVWVTDTGLTERARALITEIRKADDWGLEASRFDTPAPNATFNTVQEKASAELNLTKAAITYADHARGGRILPQNLTKFLDMTPELERPEIILERLHRADDTIKALQAFHPQHPQFQRLRKAYLDLRGKPEQRHERIPPGKLLKAGVVDKRVPLLRKRLSAPVPTDEEVNKFDAELTEAVKAWQRKRGLTPDGIVGSNTIRALNKKPVNKLNTVLVNMERWRWKERRLGQLHIWNNIPEQKTRMIKDGKVIHEERIVVGKLTNQTPVFSDEMEHLVFGPKWHVPQSIKVNELLPSLRRSPDSLARQNLRLKLGRRYVDASRINWDIEDIRKYHVYQPPGGRNVLGRVKFMFPNKHIVYMHDTSSKSLFNKRRRLYSHGCMRVRNPLKLAQLILAHDQGWSASKVAVHFNNGVDEFVYLKEPIPVHNSYETARVADDGKLITFPDVYGHDKRVKAALEEKNVTPPPSPVRRVAQRSRQQTQSRQPRNFFETIFSGFN